MQVRASEAVVKLRTSVGLRVDNVVTPGNHNEVDNETAICGECLGFMWLLG